MDNRPIGIFDSGVGGLSVFSEIEKLLPYENFVFIADQLHVPYGKKTKKELETLAARIAKFLIDKNVKAIVVACNTATVYTIDYLRSKFPLPIIGTVPVIKTIAAISRNKKAAVFSTPATTKSPYLKNLIRKFANGCQIFTIGGSGLEEMVEEGKITGTKIDSILKKNLLPLQERGVDAIALGCTHYPFLKEKIQKIIGSKVAIVDSGGAVARRTKQVLFNENLLSNKKFKDIFYTTGDPNRFKKIAETLLKKRLANIEKAVI